MKIYEGKNTFFLMQLPVIRSCKIVNIIVYK